MARITSSCDRDDRQRMLLAGYQRCQRAQRTPHLRTAPSRDLAKPSPPPHRGSIPIEDCLRHGSGERRYGPHHVGHTSGIWSETTAHHPQMRVQHRAPPQYGRQPNSALHQRDDQVVVGPVRQRPGIELGQRPAIGISTNPDPDLESTIGCSGPGALRGDDGGTIEQPARDAGPGSPAKCGTSTSATSPMVASKVASRTARCSPMRSGTPVESRMVGRTAILIVLVLHQKLIDEQLAARTPMSQRGVRTASAAPPAFRWHRVGATRAPSVSNV